MKRFLGILPPWSLTVAVSVLILYLTLVPKPLPDTDIPMFPGADKLVHAVMFGTLAVAMGIDFARKRSAGTLTFGLMMLFALIATFAGGVIELLQFWMDLGRGCELWDFVADAVGAFISVLIIRPFTRFLIDS